MESTLWRQQAAAHTLVTGLQDGFSRAIATVRTHPNAYVGFPVTAWPGVPTTQVTQSVFTVSALVMSSHLPHFYLATVCL